MPAPTTITLGALYYGFHHGREQLDPPAERRHRAVVDHRGAPAGLLHACRVGRGGRERLDASGDGDAAVDGAHPLPPGGELAHYHPAGGPGAPDGVQPVRFGH